MSLEIPICILYQYIIYIYKFSKIQGTYWINIDTLKILHLIMAMKKKSFFQNIYIKILRLNMEIK